MSTKTSIKRIALVAATALTLGGFSVITATVAQAAGTQAGIAGIAFSSTASFSGATASSTPGTTTSPVAVTVVPNQQFYVDAVETGTVVSSGAISVYAGTSSAFTDSKTVSGANPGATTFGTIASTVTPTGNVIGTTDTVTTLIAPNTPGTYYLQITAGAVVAGAAPSLVAGYAVVTVTNIIAAVYDGNVAGTTVAGSTGSTSVNAVAGPSNTVTLMVPKHASTAGFVTVSGAGATIASASTGQTIAAGATSIKIASGAEDTVTVVVNTPTAGSISATYAAETSAGSGIASTTVATTTITVNATGSSGVFSVANSTVYDTTTAAVTATYNMTSVTVAAAAGTERVRYAYTTKDVLGSAYNLSATNYIVASVSGPGLIGYTTTSNGTPTTFAKTASSSATTNTGWFVLQGDGSSGVATVTFTLGSTTVATKSVTFYSTTVASLSATVNQGIVNAAAVTGFRADTGTGGVVSFISVVAKDASGNAIPSLTNLTATSSNTSVLTVGTPTWDATDLVYYVPVTGVAAGSATVTVKDSTATYSTTGTLTVAKAVISSYTVAFGASSYNAGDAATLLITAKDSTGAAVADGYYLNALAGAASVSQALTSTLFGTELHFKGGVATAKFFAPYNSGTLTAIVYTGSSTTVLASALQAEASAVAHTATASIMAAGGGDAALALDAANAATDAANNAYDEAQNATQAAQDALAAVTALAAQVKSLIASVKSLTALVSKIKAKVGA